MRELGIAAALFLLLAGSGYVLQNASWSLLLYGGFAALVLGFVFGLPCAILYHWRLYTSLKPRGALDRHWLWNPTGHHDRLTPHERDVVMPWFYAGAVGWGACVLGCLMMGAAVLGLR